jgi:hypothetical protein
MHGMSAIRPVTELGTDWFWLLGYLGGKALAEAKAGDVEKARHHRISTAVALANWHAALSGMDNRMRPGIDTPKGLEAPKSGEVGGARAEERRAGAISVQKFGAGPLHNCGYYGCETPRGICPINALKEAGRRG